MIRVYCVGIHFRHHIDFVPDIPTATPQYMTGHAILASAAAKWGLRYKLSSSPPSALSGHIDYVGYTPNAAHDKNTVDEGSAPRVTFAAFGAKVFPFFGQPLSLTEILAPIGQASQVLQYTVQSIDKTKATPPLLVGGDQPPDFIRPDNDGRSSFGPTGFPDGVEIRIRSLNIYCTY
jgi:hypothetical protein